MSIEAYRDPLRYVRLPTLPKSVVPTTELDLDSEHHQAQVQEGKKGAKRNNFHVRIAQPFIHFTIISFTALRGTLFDDFDKILLLRQAK